MANSVLERTIAAVDLDVRAEIDKPGTRRFLDQLTAVYERAGVLQATHAPALHAACPERDACWRDFSEEAKPAGSACIQGPSEDGSVFWPWVGEHYRTGGVCVVGLNLNHGADYWSPAVEYKTVARMRARFEAGKKADRNGSMFAYRTLASAGVVIAHREGRAPRLKPRAQELASVLDGTARLQAVKCSPMQPHAENGAAKAPMPSRCPPRFFTPEIQVLRPSVILAFGNDARDAVIASASQWSSPAESRIDFGRVSATIGNEQVELIRLAHPAAHGAGWERAQASLIESLSERPLPPA